MARFLRLGSIPPPQHLRHRTVLPQTTQRWFSGSVVLEESSTTAQASNGISGLSALKEETKRSEKPHTEGSLKDKMSAVEKSSSETSDDLSSLILSKMRGKTVGTTSQKDNARAESQTSNASSTTITASTSTSTDGKSIEDSKWAQVMSSIRKIAAKNKAGEATGKSDSSKMKENENVDDFADLDLPHQRSDPSLSRSQSRSSLASAFKKEYIPNNKHQKGYQPGNLHRSKDMKPANFNFLKSRESNGSFNRTDIIGDRSIDRSIGSARDSLSNARSKDGWNQQLNKDVKPVSFEYLKAPETKSAHIREDISPPRSIETIQPTKDSVVPFSGYTVCIQGVPAHANLGVVKHTLSTHGEIVSSFKKPGSNGSCTIYIEFKTSEAMDNALTLRQIQLEGKLFTIVRADHPITTVVRISRVSLETPESHIRSICEKYGNLDNIRKRGNGFYDVFYKLRELPNIPNILESLNEVTLNQRRWVALPAPLLHPEAKKAVLNTSEGKAWHASQMKQMLNKIEVGLDAMSICFEDLKSLTHDEVLSK